MKTYQLKTLLKHTIKTYQMNIPLLKTYQIVQENVTAYCKLFLIKNYISRFYDTIYPPHIIIAVVYIFICLYLYIFPVSINTYITAKH